MQETRIQFLGREDLLEKEMATHSSTLVWKIPWTEEPGRGYKESEASERLHFHCTLKHWLRSVSQEFMCLVAQSHPTLCNPMDCSPSDSSVHVDSPGKNTGVGCHFLLQEIFPTQELKPGLQHCRCLFRL